MARNAAFGLIGGLLILVGFGFLTGALWSGLAQSLGPVLASALIGMVYVAAGCIVIVLTRHPAPPPPPPSATVPPPTPMQSVVQAFLQGMEAGSAARRR